MSGSRASCVRTSSWNRRGPFPSYEITAQHADHKIINGPRHINGVIARRVPLAPEPTAWAQILALHARPARRWEPQRLRRRIFSLAGRLARTGQRIMLQLPEHARWATLLLDAIITLRALSAAG
jgi:Transposase DDE domain group 1